MTRAIGSKRVRAGFPEKSRRADGGNLLSDLRFRTLISDADWRKLPLPVRRRFTQRLAGGNTIIYAGEVIENRLSRAGRYLAQLARLIGGPLPTSTDARVASVVSVTEDISGGGQAWTRLYARRNGFPQIIHSAKRFAGPTGLEEYIGRGVGIALTVHVVEGALVFRSAHYFVQVVGVRMRLPRWLAPGHLSVVHADVANGEFRYTLDLDHPRLGSLIHQVAAFRETEQWTPHFFGS